MTIKVLVVDDSALMRKKISELLESTGGITVKTAKNGREAISQNLEFQPDVMTLDINMPELDGLTALAEIMLQRPVPVVMLSSLTAKGALATLEAMALGAVDYIPKPDGTISLAIDDIEKELLTKIRNAAKARPKTFRSIEQVRTVSPSLGRIKELPSARKSPPDWSSTEPGFKVKKAVSANSDELTGLVLIGVSTGGPGTLEMMLASIPTYFPYPIVIAQHMPAAFTGPFASRLNNVCSLEVTEVSHLQKVEAGKVYIARGDADLVFTNRAGVLHLQPKPADPQFRWHPSVELLGRSALECCHADGLIAILLTGMGDDGAEAFSHIHVNGGRTIAESEDSAVVFGMPKELIERGGASLVLPANKIVPQLLRWANAILS
jgi:two-component system chemotaxis response regulator CheB